MPLRVSITAAILDAGVWILDNTFSWNKGLTASHRLAI